jgi:hypothetical protein
MHPHVRFLFEYAISSSVEFCSISYSHPSLSGLKCMSFCCTQSNSHNCALPSCIPTSPYRTHPPQCRPMRSPKLIMVQPNFSFLQPINPFHPSVGMRLYIPAPAPFCKYCLLVVFHAAMYFSMQFVKVVCSEEEMEEPGLGMARSKQCSLTFWEELLAWLRREHLLLIILGLTQEA